jgi:DNA-directed RNA polymerase subunit L
MASLDDEVLHVGGGKPAAKASPAKPKASPAKPKASPAKPKASPAKPTLKVSKPAPKKEVTADHGGPIRLSRARLYHYAYNLDSLQGLVDPACLARAQAALPPMRDQLFEFEIANTNPYVANAIRRSAVTECQSVALEVRLENIKTNEEYVVLDQLIERIGLIPLDQRVPVDTVFHLECRPDTVGYATTAYLVPKTKLVGIPEPFSPTYRLCTLRPGRYLKISEVRVVSGRGHIHAKHVITSWFRFVPLDLYTVDYLGPSGRTEAKHVLAVDLLARMGDVIDGRMAKSPGKPRTDSDLRDLRVLVIPNPVYYQRAQPSLRPIFSRYDLVFQNPKEEPYSPLAMDDYIKCTSNLVYDPTHYYQCYRTYGTIGARELVIHACTDLIDRMQSMRDSATRSLAEPEASGAELVRFVQAEQQNHIRIEGEDHTMGHLIAYEIHCLCPSISYVAAKVDHPLTRQVDIILVHPDPGAIFLQVCDHYIRLFGDLRQSLRDLQLVAEERKLSLPTP